MLFSGVRPFVVASAEAEGSPEAVAEAVLVAVAVAEADADAVALGVVAAEAEAVVVSGAAEVDSGEEAKGRLPQAARDRTETGMRAMTARRIGESFEELMARE